MKIRKAEPADLEEMLQVYETARRFMRSTGNMQQWNNGYPQREVLARDIAAGASYVAEENGKIEVVFFFRQGEDPTYRVIEGGSWVNDAPYAVVHRIASRGAVQGAGAACLQWCFERWPNLRIDTHADNRVMQHVLEKNGFVKCGTIYIEDGTPRIAYQKAGETQP